MRAQIAVRLVRYVGGWLDSAYRCNCYGAKRTERVCAWCYRRARPLLDVACKIDKNAAVDQMVVECWWG